MIQLRGGFVTSDPRLDRLPSFDEKSRNFQVRKILTLAAPKQIKTTIWQPGPTLDQGTEGACVGFGSTHRFSGEPHPQSGVSQDSAFALYKRAQQLDEWEGEHYSGTSVLAGCKAALEAGHITAYHWIGAGSGTPIDDVTDTLSNLGGIIFGLSWSKSMFEPRPSGLFEVDFNSMAGGHCIYAFGLILNAELPGEPVTDVVALQNSWGPDFATNAYGQGGVCYLKLTDLEKLLERGGEGAVVAPKVAPAPVAP